jgi:UDP-N-acetylglucosamine 2-epimerase
MHAMSIVGARPQFVKLAPIAREFDKLPEVRHSVVHTGQHYDSNMSEVFFDELNLPRPDCDLGVGSASHATQTGHLMQALEKCFLEQAPDVVLVYGDTNSTLAACLAAAKMHIPVAHIEAGLRSFNRHMPEEINRIVADHTSNRLYVPSPTGMQNLNNENLATRAVFSGDVMRDVVNQNLKLASRNSDIAERLSLTDGQFALLTLHRPVNTTEQALIPLLNAVASLAAADFPIIFPVHPRTRAVLEQCDAEFSPHLRLVEPLAYLDMLQATQMALVVLTDSGGLQKEAAFLQTQCITLREETEWVETLQIGINKLVGQNTELLYSEFRRAVATPVVFDESVMRELDRCFGAGDAAHAITRDVVASF